MPEQGDAGDLPASAQDVGADAVTVITGAFTSGGDADMYRFCLSGGKTFSASTVGGSERDTQLFLFNSGGFGVYANDDAWAGVRTSLLPANHAFTPSAAGEYFLAISSFNREPQSSLGPIFPDTSGPLVVDARDRGASQPVSDWMGLNRGAPGAYRINFTGTKSCTPPDTTAPTVDLRSPRDGARVRQGAEVVVDFSCSDEAGGSGLDSCTGSLADGALLDTSDLGPASVTVTARDKAGNQRVVTHTVTVVDETAPTISLSSPGPDAVYQLGEQVAADYSCQDEPGGSGLESCSGNVADGAAVDTSSLGAKTFTVNASDNAGNTASKSVSYTVVDLTAPAITIAAPADGAVYVLGQSVLADYSCVDEPAGSGVASCAGSVPSGQPLDTSSVGTRSFTVDASDVAGNAATKTVSYSVVYDFDGFLAPLVNLPQVNRWRAGAHVPVRFSLNGYRGASPEATGYPRSRRCGDGDGEPVRAASKTRPVFRYERRSDRYVLNWKTERKWAGGCREFVLVLEDGSVHTARFQFARR